MSQALSNREYKSFRQAIIISGSVHLLLFILILVSPYLPTHSKKGLVHYVNVVSFSGGGGGGGSSGALGAAPGETVENETVDETALPEREDLSDLTVPKNIEQQQSSLRHPVDKPKNEKKADSSKKTVIQKATKTSPTKTKPGQSEQGAGGGGTGLRIGVGGGGGGGIGFGSEYSSQIGLSSFPYTWYLQTLHGRISNNWYTSRISTGLSGDYYTTVSFRIFSDGQISEPKILEPSGVKSLDLSAVRAVRSSAPFPALPSEYKEEYLQLTIIFEHTK
ncbi:MAG: TonB family protein [Candidatus Aminicenantes bacterium]|nr:TonB family protein [Candidatus Aminicenantes bacterium]